MFYDNVFLFILEAVNFFPECYEGELKQEYTCECPVTDRHQIITTAYDRSNPEFICPMNSCENFSSFGTLEKLNAHLHGHKDLPDQFVPKSPAPNIETSYDSVLQLHSPSVSPSTVLASDDELSETPFTLSSLPISSIDNLKSFPDSETLISPEQTDSPNISPLPFTTFSYSDSYFRRDNMLFRSLQCRRYLHLMFLLIIVFQRFKILLNQLIYPIYMFHWLVLLKNFLLIRI